MIPYGHGISGYILSFLSVIVALVTDFLSLTVILIILYHLHHHRRQLKREEKITLVLSSHIYLYILMSTTVLSLMNIQSLIGDIYGNNFNSPWCVFQGYWFLASAGMIYYGFAVQAIFRLFRIVYPNYPRLQSYWIFIASAPLVLIQINMLLFPLLLWNDVVYLPTEHYCIIDPKNIRGALWVMCTCYFIPLNSLALIQFRITRFLRQQSATLSAVVKQKQQRDLVVIRRIFITVGVLLAIGLPASVIGLVSLIDHNGFPFGRRITSIIVEMSFTILSIQMIIMTPQLKKLMMARWRANRVTTIEHGTQMRITANR